MIFECSSSCEFSEQQTCNMETEERPNKIRKVEHIVADLYETTPVSPPVDNESQDENVKLTQNPDPPTERDKTNKNDNDVFNPEAESIPQKLSKNQLKKQRRFEQWEAGREDRKL